MIQTPDVLFPTPFVLGWIAGAVTTAIVVAIADWRRHRRRLRRFRVVLTDTGAVFTEAEAPFVIPYPTEEHHGDDARAGKSNGNAPSIHGVHE